MRRWKKNPVQDQPEIPSEGRFGLDRAKTVCAAQRGLLRSAHTVYLDPKFNGSISPSALTAPPRPRDTLAGCCTSARKRLVCGHGRGRTARPTPARPRGPVQRVGLDNHGGGREGRPRETVESAPTLRDPHAAPDEDLQRAAREHCGLAAAPSEARTSENAYLLGGRVDKGEKKGRTW